MKKVINPALPVGYKLLESNEAHLYLGDGKYTITTGKVQAFGNEAMGPVECEDKIMDCCFKYKDKYKWIDRIHFGFELSS